MTTCVKYLHGKFGIAPSSVSEEDARGVESISDFWEFLVEVGIFQSQFAS